MRTFVLNLCVVCEAGEKLVPQDLAGWMEKYTRRGKNKPAFCSACLIHAYAHCSSYWDRLFYHVKDIFYHVLFSYSKLNWLSTDNLLPGCHDGYKCQLLVFCSDCRRTGGCLRDCYAYGKRRVCHVSDITVFDRAAYWSGQGKEGLVHTNDITK